MQSISLQTLVGLRDRMSAEISHAANFVNMSDRIKHIELFVISEDEYLKLIYTGGNPSYNIEVGIVVRSGDFLEEETITFPVPLNSKFFNVEGIERMVKEYTRRVTLTLLLKQEFYDRYAQKIYTLR